MQQKGEIMKKLVFLIILVCLAVFSIFVIQYRKSTRLTMIQTVLQDKLDTAVEKYQADNAIGIVINAKTGKIITKYETSSENAIFTKNFEFGHLTSVFNTVIALENGISADKSILLESKNAEQMKLATDLPEYAQSKFFDKIHFNDVLTVDSNTTVQPDLPTKWTKSEREKAGIGYGIKITPIHLIYGLNVVVNDGLYVDSQNNGSKRVISSENSSKIRNIMREIVETTIPNSAIQNIGIKTASIENSDKETITTAVFATFPIENPEYSMLVILDNPHATESTNGWKTASVNVVPLTGQILTEIMPILEK